ncbi:conserved Plasmodium protein, unknown function [Plasmodium relictum]|uniref:Uncharacterized protein n=1 Tax=Plasmodium relictum TaxID=85471 RepID=A0A1J1H1Z8_PLARL|nr:conserved Plasmodium protein, unknown function [Plasmodium relictum]CRG98946.1 conserved Plasmodium protein, unknown function [Plasmodium relictum]
MNDMKETNINLNDEKKKEYKNKITNFFKIKYEVKKNESNQDLNFKINDDNIPSGSHLKNNGIDAKGTILKKKLIEDNFFRNDKNFSEKIQLKYIKKNDKNYSETKMEKQTKNNNLILINSDNNKKNYENVNLNFIPKDTKSTTIYGTNLKKKETNTDCIIKNTKRGRKRKKKIDEENNIININEKKENTNKNNYDLCNFSNKSNVNINNDLTRSKINIIEGKNSKKENSTNNFNNDLPENKIYQETTTNIPNESKKIVKSRKISLVNFFGNDIEITVNVNEDINSENETSSENSFKCVKNNNKLKFNNANIESEKEKKNLESLYRRNSISDYENYNHSNYRNEIDNRKNQIENKKVNNNQKKKNTSNNTLIDKENSHNPLTADKLIIENKRILKSDNELDSQSIKRKRTKRIRNSCIGIEIKKDNKYFNNKDKRRSCLNIEFTNNLDKKEKNNLIQDILPIDVNNKGKEDNKNVEKKKEEEIDRNNYNNNFYQLQNVQEKLTSIKNNYRLNDNVSDILNEKRKIKILRILNKYYFDKEYNKYINLKNKKTKSKKKNSIELLRDKSNKPYTFFIAGKFIYFSNFVLTKKLKDIGYSITNNIRRCNSLVLGYDLSSDILRKISNFDGEIFNEKRIMEHLKINLQKYLNIFTPINKNNGKKYKFYFNETNIKNADVSLIDNKLHNFCKSISNLLDSINVNNLDNNVLNDLKKKLNNFLLFLHISKNKFQSDINSILYYYKKNYALINLLNEENFTSFILFFKKICNLFSTCYINNNLLTLENNITIEIYLKNEENSKEDHNTKKESLKIEEKIKEGINENNVINNKTENTRKNEILHYTENNESKNFVNARKFYMKNVTENEIQKEEILNKEKYCKDDFLFDHMAINDYFEDRESNEISNDKEANDNLNLVENKILQNIKKSEKLKKIDNLWSSFFKPNSLYEIAGHKNEILRLYKILKKKFHDHIMNIKYENVDYIEKVEKKKNTKKEIESDINIIFLIYPPNSGVKRLVELICYACDLCPIYENKVQKYKNINYFFKYTHGLKAISIYNANRLDKNSIYELNLRNDVCICLYEDKNYIINNFNNFNPPLLDNIKHFLIKFSYPSKKALFYRCFAVSSCVIKNLKKKTFKLLFEICKLKNFSYSIESVYNKLHLISIYINYIKNNYSFEKESESNNKMNVNNLKKIIICDSNDSNTSSNIYDDDKNHLLNNKFADKNYLENKNDISFPNNIIYEYITSHLLNRFLINNHEEIEYDIFKQNDMTLYKSSNLKNLNKLNNDYYFYGGFDLEEINDIVYDCFDKLYLRHKNDVILDFNIKKNNMLEDNIDYLYMNDKSKKERESILIKVLELYLFSSILIKTNDINISLIAIDMVVYWSTFLYMNPSFSRTKHKKQKSIYQNEETINLNNNDYINQIKLKDQFKNKIDKCNKIYSEKIKKYKHLMLHFKFPFNFSSANIVYDILQSNKIVNFNLKKK